MMRIAMCATEAVPFAKTGGMADVAGALPAALKKTGQECMVLMPFYTTIFENNYDFKRVEKGLNVPMSDTEEEFYDLLETKSHGVTFYFIKNDKFFDRNYLYGSPKGDYRDNPKRFGFFCKAVLSALEQLRLRPDIIHLNDYHTALAAVFLDQIRQEGRQEKDFFKHTSTVFTIHNLAYQGIFDRHALSALGLGDRYFSMEGLEYYGRLNFMKGGILFSDKITTVSPTYAREILTPAFGEGLDGVLRTRECDLGGIINGIDYQSWNPENDPALYAGYSRDHLDNKLFCKVNLLKNYFGPVKADCPLIGVVSRLSEQKGIDLIYEAAEPIMDLGFLMIILGSGDDHYQRMLKCLQERYKGRLRVHIGYSDTLARLIYAGSDMFLMPSKYEPCGLGQLISLRYGTVPVVRDTGGLSDTIIDVGRQKDISCGANGFKFKGYKSSHMLQALQKALSYYKQSASWKQIIQNGMACDFSWKNSAQLYKKLYASLRK